MNKVVGEYSTVIEFENEEPKEICKLGLGQECCAFLVCGFTGFECWRMNYPDNTTIFSRLEAGTMNAKGIGEWAGCPWKDE